MLPISTSAARRRLIAGAAAVGLALPGAAVSVAQEVPAVADAGQCFGRARLPDAVTLEHRHQRRRGSVRRLAPALVHWTQTRVLASPARTEPIELPARYRAVIRVIASRGPARWTITAPRYVWSTTRVQVAPERLAWAVRRGAPAFADVLPGQTELAPTGEVLCRVRVPARFALRRHRVLVEAGRRIALPGAVMHRRVFERVLTTPARTLLRTHPAVYRIVRHAEEVQAARMIWVTVPAVAPETRTMVRTARAGWVRVVCPSGLAPWAMQRLQESLAAHGYAAGSADGRSRPETGEALRRFQHDHGLAEGPITVESARALGVIP